LRNNPPHQLGLQDWKYDKLTSADVTIQVGETREETWQQAVLGVIASQEILFKREFDTQKPTLKQIVSFFSTESELM
jgi:hypothetical protein